ISGAICWVWIGDLSIEPRPTSSRWLRPRALASTPARWFRAACWIRVWPSVVVVPPEPLPLPELEPPDPVLVLDEPPPPPPPQLAAKTTAARAIRRRARLERRVGKDITASLLKARAQWQLQGLISSIRPCVSPRPSTGLRQGALAHNPSAVQEPADVHHPPQRPFSRSRAAGRTPVVRHHHRGSGHRCQGTCQPGLGTASGRLRAGGGLAVALPLAGPDPGRAGMASHAQDDRCGRPGPAGLVEAAAPLRIAPAVLVHLAGLGRIRPMGA